MFVQSIAHTYRLQTTAGQSFKQLVKLLKLSRQMIAVFNIFFSCFVVIHS